MEWQSELDNMSGPMLLLLLKTQEERKQDVTFLVSISTRLHLMGVSCEWIQDEALVSMWPLRKYFCALA